MTIQGDPRPDLPFDLDSPTGRVRVHYTTTGVNAVPTADIDGTGIPDYVEEAVRVLDLAWNFEVGTLGFLPPPTDGSAGGSTALDVYVVDLSKAGITGGGMYGYTNFESTIGGSQPPRYYSWIAVDNDFSPDDRNTHGQPVYATTGLDGLRVTTAHELHHAIQVGAYGLAHTQRMLYELTSTWMELAVWPNLRDWATYMELLLNKPELYAFSQQDGSNGYPWGWYGAVMHSYEGKHILRKTWEHIALNEIPFQALVNASEESGVPLPQMFCDALGVLYRTGSRGRSNTVLPYADSLPEIHLHVDQPVMAPSEVVTGELLPYDVRAMRFSVPSLVDVSLPVSVTVLLTWPNNTALINSDQSVHSPFTVTLTASPSGTDTPLNGTSWGLRVTPADICFRVEGIQTERAESPYPMPIVYGKQTTLSIPIPSALPGNTATVTLLTALTVGMQQDVLNVILDDTRIVAQWHVPPTLRPGVYLLNVECAGTTTLHKIAVR